MVYLSQRRDVKMSSNKKDLKTLIVYDSKYGCTEKCAQILASKLENVEVVNVKDAPEDIGFYDIIIIGGSIYMGRIQKRIREFCKRHIKVLTKKNLGLFTTCMFVGERGKQQLLDAFPKELLEVAKAKDFFGGEITYPKMKFFDRLLIKLLSKSGETGMPKFDENRNASNLMEDKIEHFRNLIA